MDKIALINHIRNYIDLTPHEELILLEKISLRRYLKGQYVTTEGDICRSDSYIIKGSIVTFCVDSEGREHILNLSLENWWTGDFRSFIEQSPSKFNVKCIEDSLLAQISYDDYEELFIAIPKLERFLRLVVQQEYVDAENRVIDNFILSAKERYITFCEKYSEKAQRFPQYMVASYLGITKEFLSKIRKQIKNS